VTSIAGQEAVPGIKWQHIAAVTIGNALEFYDFLTYAFFSIQIGHAFFPSQTAYGSLMLSLATFGAGFLTRPLGALVIGNYADRVGRKPAMMLCFVLIGCAIVGMALLPTYARIGVAAPILAIVARMIQGFSLGGEIGTNTAYLAEAAPAGKRGLIVSWQGASQYLALIAGGLVGVLLTTVLPPAALEAYGWRIAFLLGAAVVPFGFWLRIRLPETLHVRASQPSLGTSVTWATGVCSPARTPTRVGGAGVQQHRQLYQRLHSHLHAEYAAYAGPRRLYRLDDWLRFQRGNHSAGRLAIG
jgi:MHS family citrate/tricarballylate:H+ symporter-like MFS transporter